MRRLAFLLRPAWLALFVVVVAFIGIHLPHANYGAALSLLAIASVSFIGIGMMCAVLPLISPEKGGQLGFIAQGDAGDDARRLGRLLPGVGAAGLDAVDRQGLTGDVRAAWRSCIVLDGSGLAWADVWPLLVIGVAAIPLGLVIFRIGERYAKKHGKLKRSG